MPFPRSFRWQCVARRYALHDRFALNPTAAYGKLCTRDLCRPGVRMHMREEVATPEQTGDPSGGRYSINIAESATKELAGKPRNHRNIDRVALGDRRQCLTSRSAPGASESSVLAEQDLGGAARQCRPKFGRGVPRTAIAPTTRSQNGSIPKPGTASRASPGNSSHCRPSTRNSDSAVPRSTTHTIGGKGVAKAPMASEMPATAKARTSRLLENLRSLRNWRPLALHWACSAGGSGRGKRAAATGVGVKAPGACGRNQPVPYFV